MEPVPGSNAELWQWGSLDEEESLDKLLSNHLVASLKQWRVDLEKDLVNPMLVPLCNWVVEHAYPQELACTRIAPSTIPGAGYGLFATRDIAVGRQITVYGGEYFEDKNDYPKVLGVDSAYVIELKEIETIEKSTRRYLPDTKVIRYPILDGELHFAVWEHGRWANTQRTKDECNADFVEFPDDETGDYYQVRLVAMAPIAEGQEIFVWYGSEYAKELFGGDATKKQKIQTCIQCKVKEAVTELAGYSHLGGFCNSMCASKYWQQQHQKKKNGQ
jgi:hypothetical protein